MTTLHDLILEDYIALGSDECRQLVARCIADIKRIDALYAGKPVMTYQDHYNRVAAVETLQDVQEAMALAFEREG